MRDVEFNFIELPKFKKTESELKSIIDQWVYFIKNAEDLEVIPENIKDKGLKTAFEEADKHNWSKVELEEYNKIFIREGDEKGPRRPLGGGNGHRWWPLHRARVPGPSGAFPQ